MTIKKRLFISNLLMFTVPLCLSMFLVAGTYLVLTGIVFLLPQEDSKSMSNFYGAMGRVDSMAMEYREDADREDLFNSVADFNRSMRWNNLALAIYDEDGQAVYRPDGKEEELPSSLDSVMEGEVLHVVDGVARYKIDAKPYTLLLVDSAYSAVMEDGLARAHDYFVYVPLAAMIVVVGIILLTNWALTRFVSKSIMNPLNILVNGVHEIRDGNLNYRLEYAGKDEFAGVCSDFNEMAGRLQKMVEARLQDNENRKELVAGISHDLRTPLTAIKAYVEGLETGVASTPALQRRYLDTIKNKTEDIDHIVRQLFLFSKLDVGEFPLSLETLNLGEEVKGFVSGVADEYQEKGLTVYLAHNEPEIYVRADPVQLRNVLTNILENSLKYSNRPDAAVSINVASTAWEATIRLTDNGPGVPEEVLGKLFDVFYRADRARSNPSKGSGLGLAISAKIIEGFGGKIHAENETGGGLCVVITLPVTVGGETVEKDIDY